MPLASVCDYAIGSNWFYSCAGLGALRERADRDDALETVLAYLMA